MNSKFPIFSIVGVALCVAAIAYIFISSERTSTPTPAPEIITSKEIKTPTPNPPEPKNIPTPSLLPEPQEPEPTVAAKPSPNPTPSPSAPPLDESDEHITTRLKGIASGIELVQLLTDEEIARKVVRAVYGLSQGRVVRQYRPILSPKEQITVKKIGQQTEDTKEELYRISRENGSRYTHYISIFSKLNNQASLALYQFYLPTLEQAYLELGVKDGSFHKTFLQAIDVLLSSPTVNQAILLTRPSVMYKFNDPELEKLPQAHKLMLRMGQENSEALKLELKKLRERLLQLKVPS